MYTIYITFHTHFGAMNFEKRHGQSLNSFSLRPTPRKLSSSCGVCATFIIENQEALHTYLDEHIAGIYIESSSQNFELILDN